MLGNSAALLQYKINAVGFLTGRKKEKTDTGAKRERGRQTDRQTEMGEGERGGDRQTDRQTNRDGERERQKDIQTGR